MYRIIGQTTLRAASATLRPPRLLQRVPSTTQLATRRWRGDYYKLRKKEEKVDPFQVLGIASGSSYADVKRQFLQIAMQNHPDTSKAVSEEDIDKHREVFIEARHAFERLQAGPDGIAVLRDDANQWQEDDLDAWFREETGHDMPFMDAATMREVAEMTETVGGGLDRDGGMWTLARMVTQNVKAGGDGSSFLRLESGTVRDRQIDGVLRRRRKR